MKIKYNEEYSSGGLGFFSVLGLIFIVLKLVGVIDWPWIWVLSPFWIPVALVLAIVTIVILVVGFGSIFHNDDEEEKDDD